MNSRQKRKLIKYGSQASFYDWNTDFYESTPHYDFYTDYLLKTLEEGLIVLDIGCGDGKTLGRISDKVRQGYGIENNKEHYEKAIEKNKSNKNIKIIGQDAYQPFEIGRKVDLIFSERGPVSKGNIKFIKNKLKKNGILLVETTGEQDTRVLKEVLGKGEKQWDGKSISTKTKEMLVANGLKSLRIDNHFWFQYYKDVSKLAKNLFSSPIKLRPKKKDLNKLKEFKDKAKAGKGIKLLRHWVVYAAVK